jgi:hypothetical protein
VETKRALGTLQFDLVAQGKRLEAVACLSYATGELSRGDGSMSALVEQLMQAGGGQMAAMLGGRFGLSPSQTQAALQALGPMLAGGMKQQAQAQGGLEGLLGSVLNQGHAQFDSAERLAQPGMTATGNDVLGQIFGSKDVSRQVAAQASAQTGLGADLLKKMLPVVATMVAGQLASKAMGGGLGGLLGAAQAAMGGGGAAQAPAGGVAGMGGGLGQLASMIDMDRDGNPLDDIMKMVGRG